MNVHDPPLVTVPVLRERLALADDAATLGRIESAVDDASALVRDHAGRTWIDPVTGDLTPPYQPLMPSSRWRETPAASPFLSNEMRQ